MQEIYSQTKWQWELFGCQFCLNKKITKTNRDSVYRRWLCFLCFIFLRDSSYSILFQFSKQKKVPVKRTWVERYSWFLPSSPISSWGDGSVTLEPWYSRALFPILEGTWRSSTIDRDLVLSTLGLSYSSFVRSTLLPTRLTRRRISLVNDWLWGKTEENESNDKPCPHIYDAGERSQPSKCQKLGTHIELIITISIVIYWRPSRQFHYYFAKTVL